MKKLTTTTTKSMTTKTMMWKSTLLPDNNLQTESCCLPTYIGSSSSTYSIYVGRYVMSAVDCFLFYVCIIKLKDGGFPSVLLFVNFCCTVATTKASKSTSFHHHLFVHRCRRRATTTEAQDFCRKKYGR